MKKKVVVEIEVSDNDYCSANCRGYQFFRNFEQGLLLKCDIFHRMLGESLPNIKRCEECVNSELNKQETALKTKIIERLNAELIVMGGAELSTRYRDLILQTTFRGENE